MAQLTKSTDNLRMHLCSTYSYSKIFKQPKCTAPERILWDGEEYKKEVLKRNMLRKIIKVPTVVSLNEVSP